MQNRKFSFKKIESKMSIKVKIYDLPNMVVYYHSKSCVYDQGSSQFYVAIPFSTKTFLF